MDEVHLLALCDANYRKKEPLYKLTKKYLHLEKRKLEKEDEFLKRIEKEGGIEWVLFEF